MICYRIVSRGVVWIGGVLSVRDCPGVTDHFTHLIPPDVDALIRRLDDIRTRNLAAQTRPNEPTRGIEFGGR
jgi:hypothetical protein